MSEEGKRRTLDKIKRHYGNFKQALSGQMPAEYEEQGAPQAADPLEEMAQQAIENGADPEAVRARMEQMRAQQGG